MDIRQLTQKERRDLYREVFVMALSIAKEPMEAEEITQEAFVLLLTTRPWRPDGPPFRVHLYGILRSECHHARARRRTRRDARDRFANDPTVSTGAEQPSAEAMSLDAARRQKEEDGARRDIDTLRERLADKPLDLEIIDRIAQGVTKREHLVEQTGQPMEAVKHSLARIRRTLDAILAERGDDTEDEP